MQFSVVWFIRSKGVKQYVYLVNYTPGLEFRTAPTEMLQTTKEVTVIEAKKKNTNLSQNPLSLKSSCKIYRMIS